MKTACRTACWLYSFAVIAATLLLLASDRLEYCGQSHQAPRRRVDVAAAKRPTLAPPPKVVFLHVETDEPGFEIGFAEK